MGVADPLAVRRGGAAQSGGGTASAPKHVVLTAFGADHAGKAHRADPAGAGRRAAYQPDVRLLLVGQAHAALRRAGGGARARRRRPGDDRRLRRRPRSCPAYLAASDVVLSLRWPSARETSASWLRAIAAGRPTVVTDLAQQADLPTLDPRSWTVVHAQPTLDRARTGRRQHRHPGRSALADAGAEAAGDRCGAARAAGRGGARALGGRAHASTAWRRRSTTSCARPRRCPIRR